MPSGVQFANVIDIIALDPATDEVALIMTEERPWDGSDERLFQLQEKINAYLSFALDGEMGEAYPQFVGKRLRLRLDCAVTPDSRSQQIIELVRRQIAFQEIKFDVRVTTEKSCGKGCGCDSASG